MYPIKQSTAVTVPIFVHDASGDAVTGLVDAGFTKRISKNGGAFAAMTVTITEMENGFYSVPISTSHSDTNGILTMLFTHASAKQVNLQFRVGTNLVDDVKTDTAAILIDTADIQPKIGTPAGASISADIADIPTVSEFNARTLLAADYFDPATDTVANVTTTANLTTNNDKTGYRLSAAGVDDIWDEPMAGHITADTAGLVMNDWQDAGRLDAILDTIAADVVNIDGAAMRGTDNALLASSAPTNFSDLAITVTTGQVSLLTATQNSIDAIEADTNELQTDNVPGLIAALNDISTAQVNTEVLDVMNVDTIALPGQVAPPLAPTHREAIGHLYKAYRNRKTQTATDWSLYADDETTVDQKATVSDDGTTFDKTEVVSGP